MKKHFSFNDNLLIKTLIQLTNYFSTATGISSFNVYASYDDMQIRFIRYVLTHGSIFPSPRFWEILRPFLLFVTA